MKKKKKILISAPYLKLDLDDYRQILEEHFELIDPIVDERLSEKELISIFEKNNWEIEGAIVGDDNFSKKFYDKVKNLKVIVKWGTGIDSLNKKYAQTKGIKVLNTPSAFTIPVSESTIGLILNFCRKINTSNKEMESGSWSKIQGFTINESKVGVVGLGNIGSEVAHKLEVFGCKISYYDPNINNFKYKKFNDLNNLLKNNDIITIHCDLNNTSKYLINKSNLKYLKDKILINTARGPIINNNDLETYIKNGNNIFVGLDVFEEEPLPKNHFFRKYKNIICSSHNTNTSQKFWENIHKNSIKILKANLLC